ncbi:hypothetical protein M758_9G067600 [Ceratodon purpureus]|nr:hypothetical protein M758_9G067600 [Ceratodon purpureus]
MAHGGYGRKNTGRAPLGRGGGRGRGGRGVGGVRKENEKKKSKLVSTKNQIRSIERLLKKELPAAVKEAQQKRLEELKLQSDSHVRAELERKMALRYRRVKFFERRKIERRIRRLEKQQRALLENLSEDHTTQLETVADQLHQLKEDLEYIRFFPKTEKYISLYMGKDDPEVKLKRDQLRERIKANLLAAAAAGHDLEETGSDEEIMDMSEDDFFMAGSSGDDADADDEWTDRAGEEKDETPLELVLPASELAVAQPPVVAPVVAEIDLQRKPGKASKLNKQAVKDQNQKFARALMPPPPSSSKYPISTSKSTYNADNKNRNNRSSTLSDATNNNYNAGNKNKSTRASTGSDSANNTYNAGSRNKNKNVWPSTLPDTSKRPRYQGASSATGDLARPRSSQQARSGPTSSSTSYENTKSSVSDGPVQPTKPKRKRRPKKKKA